jgi:hypothetical protein
VPDWDNTESRESDEDAAWRDLVARFEAPAIDGQPAPWPERENVDPARGTRGVERAEGVRGAKGSQAAEGKHRVDGASLASEADGSSGANGADETQEADRSEPAGGSGADGTAEAPGDERASGSLGTDGIPATRVTEGAEGAFVEGEPQEAAEPEGADEIWGMHGGEGIWVHEPNAMWAADRAWRGSARGMPQDDPDEEHFVPPTPPALPKLDPVTKGAWLALFGGPGYLVLATAVGWSIPGLAAFCAVAAFVAGFAVLVLRMHEPDSERPDDNDDGAVV